MAHPDPQKVVSQQAYIIRRKKAGICLRCPGPAMPDKVLCESCTVKMRIKQRERNHNQPWHEGGRGRPPIYNGT